MKKLILISAIFAIFSSGCTPLEQAKGLINDGVAEEVHLDSWADSSSQSVKLDSFEGSVEEVFLDGVYATDGDTIIGTVRRKELLAAGFTESMIQQLEKENDNRRGADYLNVKVRYLLTDTPESVHPDIPKPQPFAKEASLRNKELVASGRVSLRFGIGDKLDKYNRLLAYVYVKDTFVQYVLIQEGYARVAYVTETTSDEYHQLIAAQESAKVNKRKIWSIEGYVGQYGFNQ